MFLTTLTEEAASSALLRNRLRLCAKGDEADSDAGAGDDLSDDAQDDTLKEGEDEDEARAAGEQDEDDENLSDDEKTYRKRFGDTKADRDRLKNENESLRQELEELRRQQGAQGRTQERDDDRSAQPDEARLADAAADAAEAEFFKLPKDQQTSKAWSRILIRETLKQTQQQAREASRQTYTEEELRERGRQEGERLAKEALKGQGLDPVRDFKLLKAEIKDQIEQDPTWFNGKTPAQQYEGLAKRVKEYVDTIRLPKKEDRDEANDEHRREAGTLGAGTRRGARPTPGKDKDEDTDKPDNTMMGAMALDRANLRRRGSAAFRQVSADRR